jgi:hypothetical protein
LDFQGEFLENAPIKLRRRASRRIRRETAVLKGFVKLRESGFRVVSQIVIGTIVMAHWGNCHEGNSMVTCGGLVVADE